MRIAALAAALGLLTWAATGHTEIDEDRFASEEWRVAMKLPKNWQITEQTSYPNILLRMVRRSPDAKMLLSAERVEPSLDSEGYAAETAVRLERIGFAVRAPQRHAATGAYWMDLDDGRIYLRQAVLVAGGFGYSLTLSTTDSTSRGQLLRVFDQTLRTIRTQRGPSPAANEAAP